jgi:carbon-monoxide dehydrogenase small subunit
MLVACSALLAEHPQPTKEQVREAISGNLCRCTGYQQIVDAVMHATRPLGLTHTAGEGVNHVK